MLCERIKNPVVVQQVIPTLDAAGSNHRIGGLANGHAEVAQRPEVLRRLNRDFLPAQLYHDQRSQHFLGLVEVPVVVEALQDFRQNQVANGQRLGAKQPVEHLGLRRDGSLEVVDPHAGIDQDQWSLLIALRSPCQSSLPRSRRISAWLLSRSKVRRPCSTAARLVFRPVARSASRISLSSITIFVRIDEYSITNCTYASGTIVFCRLLQWVCGPRNFMKKVWGPSLLVERACGPQRRLPSRRPAFSTLSVWRSPASPQGWPVDPCFRNLLA